MKRILIEIAACAIIIIIFCVSWELFGRTHFITDKIKIVKEIKTEYRIIKIPQTEQDFKKCYESRIKIDAEMKTDNIMLITARDNCKKTLQEIELDANKKTDYTKQIVIGGALCTFTLLAGVGIGGWLMFK